MGTRIITGVLLAAALAAVLYFGGFVQLAVFTLVTIIAVYEMQRILKHQGYCPCMVPAYLFAAGYSWIAYFLDTAYLVFFWVLCVLITITERIVNKQRTTKDCFAALGIYVWPLPFFALLLLAGMLKERAMSLTALVLAFAAPLCGDTLAYFVGSGIGRHKLCPNISPKKTVEGSIASVCGSMLGGVIVYFLQQIWMGATPWLPLLILGIICGAVGQVGDLFASTVKRWADFKDFGNIFAGHGGVLDRVDSVLLCAPVIYIYFYAVSYGC